jgi:ankyrin repeat protein
MRNVTLILCCNSLEDSVAVQVVKVLLPHCSSFAENNFELGGKMLAHAVYAGKLQVAQTLHAAGAGVQDTKQYGGLIHRAAISGNLAVMKWLQSLGLDARALSAELQLLPLHYACQHQHLQLVKYLLSLPDAGHDVHAQSTKGRTPLHYAAEYEADSVVQLLLERGADVDARDSNDSTPLVDAGSLAVMKLLLAAGADAAVVTDGGATVLQSQARHNACAGTICLLLKAGADPTATVSIDGISVTAAAIAGINGHFALEALLSRAADDYRKKHPTAAGTVSNSGSSGHDSSSSGSANSTSSSSSLIGAAAEHSDSATVTDASSSTAAVASTTADDDGDCTITADKDSATSAAAAVGTGDACDTSSTQQQQQQQQQQQPRQRKAKQPCANCSKPLLSCADAVQLCTTAV